MILKKKAERLKAERLKNEGLRYDAKEIKIVPNDMVMIGNSTPTHLKCSYQNENGETCMVRSKSFSLPFSFEFLSKADMVKNGYSTGEFTKYLYNNGTRIEVPIKIMRNKKRGFDYVLYDWTAKYLKAVIYVNSNDPMDYHVEIFGK